MDDYLSYQVAFVFNFYLIFLLMKFTSWKICSKDLRPNLVKFLFASPLLSARIYVKTKYPKIPFLFIFFKLCLSILFLACVIFISKNLLLPLNYFKIVLIAPMIYLFTEVLGGIGQLLFYPSSNGIPSIHRNPLISKSLGEFWGMRWNFWVRDWLIDVSRPHKKVLFKKLGFTFLISGLFHELMVNLPHFLYYHESFFGNMTLYFIIQALGLWIEKKWLSNTPLFLGRLYLWSVVILPSPIFINRPLLEFFGIIDG
jgi:hypothetical protein